MLLIRATDNYPKSLYVWGKKKTVRFDSEVKASYLTT